MITRGATDALVAVLVALVAAGLIALAFLFWWPLVSYAFHYWAF